MSKLLINENPLQVLPSLAVKIGLNEAIVLQQIHYWLERSEHFYDGRTWIYNSVSEWQKQFPFWCSKTINTTIKRLINKKLLLTGNYNKSKFDRTIWYSIDYDELEKLEIGNDETSSESIWKDLPNGEGKDHQTNTREYISENTNTENTEKDSPTELKTSFQEKEESLSPKGELKTSVSRKQQVCEKRINEAEQKWVITQNHIIKIMSDMGYPANTQQTQTAIQMFKYYYRKYRIHTGHSHPNLNDKCMRKVLHSFIDYPDIMDDYTGIEVYTELIDKHFDVDYGAHGGNATDWNIQFFMQKDVLEHLFYQNFY